MKDALQTINEVRERAARFDGDPRTSVPCLECGRAIRRERLTEPRFIICNGRCVRRFNARMKADGHDPARVRDRAFRDIFGLSRGFGELSRERSTVLPLMPDAEVLLIYSTSTMAPGGIAPYRETRELFKSFW